MDALCMCFSSLDNTKKGRYKTNFHGQDGNRWKINAGIYRCSQSGAQNRDKVVCVFQTTL